MINIKILTLIILCIGFLSGCTQSSISDNTTQEKPLVVKKEEEMMNIYYEYDGMARTETNYVSGDHGNIVVDPNYYTDHEFTRGEVIYFQTPKNSPIQNPDRNIARIVALPGETIEIKKGQIYIYNKRLDAFYGKAAIGGLTRKEFVEFFKANPGQCDTKCMKNQLDEFYDMNRDSIVLSDQSLYVIGDNWARSLDSNIFNALPTENVIGKVLGYEKK